MPTNLPACQPPYQGTSGARSSKGNSNPDFFLASGLALSLHLT
jgi:hypothetical protein